MTTVAARALPWRHPLTWTAVAAAALFFGLGLRAVLAPVAASGTFGVPLEGGDGLAYVQAFGARNMGLALTGLLLVVLDQRRAFAGLLAAAALVAAVDATAVGQHAGLAAAAKHLGYVAALGGFAAWVGLRGR